MPRVSTKSTDESIKPAPRKRAVRRTLTTDDEEVRAPRKRAPRKVAPAPAAEEVQARRAPTRFAAEATSKTKQRKTLMIVAVVLAAVSGLAAFIGSTDSGQINVSARIEAEANRQPQATQSVEGGEANGTVTVPVQNTPPAAISGLKGRGVGTSLVEQPAPVTEEATSTEVSASSTEAQAEESQPEEAPVETSTTEPEPSE